MATAAEPTLDTTVPLDMTAAAPSRTLVTSCTNKQVLGQLQTAGLEASRGWRGAGARRGCVRRESAAGALGGFVCSTLICSRQGRMQGWDAVPRINSNSDTLLKTYFKFSFSRRCMELSHAVEFQLFSAGLRE